MLVACSGIRTWYLKADYMERIDVAADKTYALGEVYINHPLLSSDERKRF
jgi:hypothetical protein